MAKTQRWRNAAVTVLIAEAGHMNCQLVESTFRPKGKHVVVVASAVRANEAVELAKDKQPDVALISAELEDGGLQGYRVLRELRVESPRTRGVMLLHSREPELVIDAFRCGARGVVFRDEPIEILDKAIHAVHRGQVWANSEILRCLVEALAKALPLHFREGHGIEQLSKRELDVARLVADGLSNKDIAVKLGISEHTVRNYLFHIFDKLGVSTRVELVLHCIDQGPPGTMAPTGNDVNKRRIAV